jgi:hypothetical protein
MMYVLEKLLTNLHDWVTGLSDTIDWLSWNDFEIACHVHQESLNIVDINIAWWHIIYMNGPYILNHLAIMKRALWKDLNHRDNYFT